MDVYDRNGFDAAAYPWDAEGRRLAWRVCAARGVMTFLGGALFVALLFPLGFARRLNVVGLLFVAASVATLCGGIGGAFRRWCDAAASRRGPAARHDYELWFYHKFHEPRRIRNRRLLAMVRADWLAGRRDRAAQALDKMGEDHIPKENAAIRDELRVAVRGEYIPTGADEKNARTSPSHALKIVLVSIFAAVLIFCFGTLFTAPHWALTQSWTSIAALVVCVGVSILLFAFLTHGRAREGGFGGIAVDIICLLIILGVNLSGTVLFLTFAVPEDVVIESGVTIPDPDAPSRTRLYNVVERRDCDLHHCWAHGSWLSRDLMFLREYEIYDTPHKY